MIEEIEEKRVIEVLEVSEESMASMEFEALVKVLEPKS